MTLRLYQFSTSPFCAKIRKILDYKGADYELIEVDYLERKELLLTSGQLTVPALTLETGETMIESERIALRLEELYPGPTIFPPQWRGLHLALARYFDRELEDSLFRAAVPDKIAHYRRLGSDHEALWRLIREHQYGAGFCDNMIRDRGANLAIARELLAPLDETLLDRAFILGRIGYADFALYGQLSNLAFTGELKIPMELGNLRAFYGRMDRISSLLDPNA